MKHFRSKLERMLPFMTVADVGVPDGQGGTATGSLAPEALQAEGAYSRLELRSVTLKAKSLARLQLYRALLHRCKLEDVDLGDARISHSALRESQFEGCTLEGAEWSVVDAEQTTLKRCNLRGLQANGVSLRDAVLEEVDLSDASFRLCDAFGARWKGVSLRGATLTGVDMAYSSLEEVDLTDADIRGVHFNHAVLQGIRLEGARVDDADFRGAEGLTEADRAYLRRGGARLYSSWLELRLVEWLEGRDAGWTAGQVDARAVWGARLIRGGLWLGALLAVGLWFVAGKAGPVPHPAGPSVPVESAPAAIRTPTADEIARTRANLLALREAIQAAYETAGRYGIARYPTLDDLANGEFDRDGMGPAAEKVSLLPGGMPANFLTAGEGVVPYCNDPATQNTLTGDDTDWHYCEETGRIYACGGYTDAATLSW